MRASRRSLAIGAITGAAATAVVVGILVSIGTLTGESLSGFKELIGLAFLDGPRWLAPVVGSAVIVAGGAVGALVIASARFGLLPRSLAGMLGLVGAYVAWTFVWTIWRLGPDLSTTPFLPVYSALLTLAGLLGPLVLLFVPTAILWARIVELLLAPSGSKAT